MVQINFSRLKENIKKFKKPIIAVVKADAYGHGMKRIAKVLSNQGVKMFAVANPDEGIKLRKQGTSGQILVMGMSFKNDFKSLIESDIDIAIHSIEMANELQCIAQELGKTARAQIYIDTGMARLGFMPTKQTINEINQILAMNYIKVAGMFGHLASPQNATYTKMQNKRFLYVTRNFKDIPLHLGLDYDFVRPGLALYDGVMGVKSAVSFLKTIPKGECVGYDQRFCATRPTVIATVPVGYANGLSRRMGEGRGRVLINGEYAQIVGSVCMDQFMVDVTDIAPSVGDEVVIMGTQGDKQITAKDIALICQTIPYEIVCKFGKCVDTKD